MDDPSGFGILAGAGILAFLIWAALTIGAVVLSVWITYTIIWRAVRRGLREYYNEPARNLTQYR
ncbi:MAG TPA: hypothetical protein VN241_02655 [Microbacterium sp.]|nr:hypothetical protein [Microbacterium sp.]